MRKLSKREIKKRDCIYCMDSYNIDCHGALEKSALTGRPRNLYCKHEKCPYKKDDDTITSFALFDRVGNYFG